MASEYNNSLAATSAAYPGSVYEPVEFLDLSDDGYAVTAEALEVPAAPDGEGRYRQRLRYAVLDRPSTSVELDGTPRDVVPYGEAPSAGQVALSIEAAIIEYHASDAENTGEITYTARGSLIHSTWANTLQKELAATQTKLDAVATAASGTMAAQDANAVNIDGGAVDGTVIGASDPAAGTFTALAAAAATITAGAITGLSELHSNASRFGNAAAGSAATPGTGGGTPEITTRLMTLHNPGLEFTTEADETAYARFWFDDQQHEFFLRVNDGGTDHRFIFDSHGVFETESIVLSDVLTLDGRIRIRTAGSAAIPAVGSPGAGIYFPTLDASLNDIIAVAVEGSEVQRWTTAGTTITAATITAGLEVDEIDLTGSFVSNVQMDEDLAVDGTLTANGNTVIGNADTDTCTINADLSLPNATSSGNRVTLGADWGVYRSAAGVATVEGGIVLSQTAFAAATFMRTSGGSACGFSVGGTTSGTRINFGRSSSGTFFAGVDGGADNWFNFGTSAASFKSAIVLGWTSSADPFGTVDTSFRRKGAGVVGFASDVDLDSGKVLKVNGTQVVGAQGAAVADASGGSVVDVEARAALNALLARNRSHGLIAT